MMLLIYTPKDTRLSTQVLYKLSPNKVEQGSRHGQIFLEHDVYG
jgi:hypothetical protein